MGLYHEHMGLMAYVIIVIGKYNNCICIGNRSIDVVIIMGLHVHALIVWAYMIRLYRHVNIIIYKFKTILRLLVGTPSKERRQKSADIRAQAKHWKKIKNRNKKINSDQTASQKTKFTPIVVVLRGSGIVISATFCGLGYGS